MIAVMISPDGCWGRPHIACEEAGIPIVEVLENKTIFSDNTAYNMIQVDNYLEAAGLLMSMRAGVHPASVRRPFPEVDIL
ncbi:hypothetical protein LCGC14_2324210 [marine sediment metagenome]|uniref:Uncharacterized protein n=1 Tax=marine sediment metagenome TaxID=412755 RepID=A0A0F9FBP5_9ZZZZ